MLAKQDQNQVKSIFVAGLQDEDVEVRLMGLRATIDYILIVTSAVRNGLVDVLPLVLNVIQLTEY